MEFVSMSLSNAMGSIPLKFLPSQLTGLEAWCRFNAGITVTGAGVSQWDDQSGNGNHLKQGTDTNRPSKEADGSILFDGADSYLKTDPFTLNQAETIYILGKQVTWTDSDRIFDGNAFNSGMTYQVDSTPNLRAFAGDAGAATTDLALDTYGVISVVFDHDNSLNVIQINNNTPATDVLFGTGDMGGFTLGASGTPSNYSNIQIKEIAVYSAAHDAATRAQVTKYLADVGNLSI